MSKTKKLFVNTLILTATSFLMRTVAVSFNVYLSNKIGPAGIGLFQLIMTVYSLAITVGAAGIRLASTRLVVAYSALDKSKDTAIMQRCILYGLLMGSMAAILLFFGAETAGLYWLEDIKAIRPMRILAISLPFISMSAALNGFFTARGAIPRYAFVQLAEQGIKIFSIVTALSLMKNPDIESASAVLVLGTSVSEIISFLLSYGLFSQMKRSQASQGSPPKGSFAQLARIAVPDAIGSTARSILLTVEHLMIPKGFRKAGSSEESSLAIYGTIHGMVLPIILYPSAILTSLSSLMVPEIARHKAENNEKGISAITAEMLHLTFLFSLGAAGIFFAFADKFSLAIYGSDASGHYIRVLAPLIPIMYMDMMVDGFLKGLDQQLQSMTYNIFDSALCVVLVYVLLPRYAVKGYIFIIFISEILNFFLSFNRLIKITQLRMDVKKSILKPLSAIFAAILSVNIFFSPISGRVGTVMELLVFASFTMFFYFLYLYLTACIAQEDVRRVGRLLA